MECNRIGKVGFQKPKLIQRMIINEWGRRENFLNCQLINIEGIVKSRNHHFVNIIVIVIDPGKNHSWMLNEKWWRKRYSLKVLPHKLFVNYKGENSNFILDKPADAILIQVNITITNEGINWHHVPFLWTSLLWYLPQIYYI